MRRVAPEFRLTPADAVTLVQEEVFARMSVHGLPTADRLALLKTAAQDGIAAAAFMTRTSPKLPALRPRCGY